MFPPVEQLTLDCYDLQFGTNLLGDSTVLMGPSSLLIYARLVHMPLLSDAALDTLTTVWRVALA